MHPPIKIADRMVGDGRPAFIIAEAGVNHNGDVDKAFELIRVAKRAGADCVKFQTFKAERVVTQSAPKASYQMRVSDPAESQLSMLKKLELSEDAYADLIALCDREGIIFTSTPYNEEDIEFLDSLGVPLLKSASIHIAEPRFLQRMAETGRPLVVSTGMATWDEIDEAVRAIRSTGNENFVLLQCTTNYPSRLADTNLRAMVSMRERFDCNVGYSDHTQSHAPCIGSIALGACVVEKHLTLDRAMSGPDHLTSESPEEFATLVTSIREMEVAMGSPEKAPTEAERANMPGMRRSIVARRAIAKGSPIEDDDLTCRRPLSGIPPREWEQLLGRIALRDIPAGEMLERSALGQFRRMRADDLPALERMLSAESTDYMQHFLAFAKAGELTRQFTQASQDVFFTIEAGGELAGFYCLRGFDAGYARPTFGLYVASVFSGQGLGRAALAHALDTCRGLNVSQVMLKVAPTYERARLIYETAGFVATGVCPDTGHTIMNREVA